MSNKIMNVKPTAMVFVIYGKKNSDCKDDILSCKFDINPKVYVKEDVSCKFCKFKDICYKKDSDVTYLEKVEDLSFLGGEE